MLQPALLGGLFIGILSALPIINIANCCCLWITGGGLLAGYLAQQDDPRPLTPGRGAMAGFLAGLAGAFFWLITAMAVDVVMAPLQERMVAEMVRNASDMPPEVREWLELLASQASSPFRLFAGVMFQLLAGGIFATLGGLLASVFFRQPEMPVVPPPLPPPPQ
jgi:hypothetical protein